MPIFHRTVVVVKHQLLHGRSLFFSQNGGPEFGTKDCWYLATADEALSVYTQLYNQYTRHLLSYTRTTDVISRHIGSTKFRQVCTARISINTRQSAPGKIATPPTLRWESGGKSAVIFPGYGSL